MSAIRLCRIATVPLFFRTLLHRQLADVAAAGIELTLVASPGEEWDFIRRTIPARVRTLAIAREPAPLRDAVSLAALTRFFHRERFDIVHSTSPKGGLLACLAGLATRVPVRLHTFTGQPWVALKGPVREMVRQADRLTARLTTTCYADSGSQRDFLVAEKIVDPRRIRVLGDGSIAGVDLDRYSVEHAPAWRSAIREELGIPEAAIVIVFVGRVTRDKGIAELVEAFQRVGEQHAMLHLLLVGPVELGTGQLPPETVQAMNADPRIRRAGFQGQPEMFLAAADIFCLPSYREGFGTAAIEAAAMGLPVVATRIAGLVDAVVDGETGILVPPKDVAATARALDTLARNAGDRRRMGQAGLARARARFDARRINMLVIEEYFRLHQANAPRHPR